MIKPDAMPGWSPKWRVGNGDDDAIEGDAMSINNERAAPGATESGSHFTSVNWGCVGLRLEGMNIMKAPGETQALKP